MVIPLAEAGADMLTLLAHQRERGLEASVIAPCRFVPSRSRGTKAEVVADQR